MSWNHEGIAAKRRNLLREEFGEDVVDSPDVKIAQLINYIVELETALYPFAYVCGSLNEKSWRGTHATSKLFPSLDDNGNFMIYQPAAEDGSSESTMLSVKTIPEDRFHKEDYEEEESITINDGTLLHDDFEILAVHQQAPGAYVGCGNITMRDVRYAINVMWPKPKEETLVEE
jgi:hypothetical protein